MTKKKPFTKWMAELQQLMLNRGGYSVDQVENLDDIE